MPSVRLRRLRKEIANLIVHEAIEVQRHAPRLCRLPSPATRPFVVERSNARAAKVDVQREFGSEPPCLQLDANARIGEVETQCRPRGLVVPSLMRVHLRQVKSCP